MPHSIGHRLLGNGPCAMLDVMNDIETAFAWLSKLASAVADDGHKKVTKLTNEVEIGVMPIICPCLRKTQGQQ